MLLEDGQSARLGGEEECRVSQAMVRVKCEKKQGNGNLLLVAIILAVISSRAGVKLDSVAARLAKSSAYGAAGVLALMSFRPVQKRVIGKLQPGCMKQMDLALEKIKEQVLMKCIQGRVLDFGCGDGQYLKYVRKKLDAQPGSVGQVVCLEPNDALHEDIQRTASRFGLSERVSVFGGFADQLVRDNGASSFDSVILGNVLCEVPDQRQVLKEIKTLLKPAGGRLFFVEHVAAKPATAERAVQHLVNPFWNTMSGGCNCNRDTLTSLESVFGHENVYAWEVSLKMPLLGRIHVGFVQT